MKRMKILGEKKNIRKKNNGVKLGQSIFTSMRSEIEWERNIVIQLKWDSHTEKRRKPKSLALRQRIKYNSTHFPARL